MTKRPLTVCIITYNEENNIRRCLESVKWADEIVVVDSKSADRTVEICREYTGRIILRDFPGHIEQKNFAVDQAKHDWVFCLDADEEATSELGESIRSVLNRELIRESGFHVSRKTEYLGEWVTYGRWYPDDKLRLFDRRQGRWGGENPHDRVEIKGETGRLRGELLHRTYRDLSHHVQVINHYTSIAARQKYAKGVRFPIFRGLISSSFYFVDFYFFRRGIFHGVRGLILSVTGAFYVFLRYAKLWEMGKARRRDDSHP